MNSTHFFVSERLESHQIEHVLKMVRFYSLRLSWIEPNKCHHLHRSLCEFVNLWHSKCVWFHYKCFHRLVHNCNRTKNLFIVSNSRFVTIYNDKHSKIYIWSINRSDSNNKIRGKNRTQLTRNGIYCFHLKLLKNETLSLRRIWNHQKRWVQWTTVKSLSNWTFFKRFQSITVKVTPQTEFHFLTTHLSSQQTCLEQVSSDG